MLIVLFELVCGMERAHYVVGFHLRLLITEGFEDGDFEKHVRRRRKVNEHRSLQ
jgi:hypothetical protein